MIPSHRRQRCTRTIIAIVLVFVPLLPLRVQAFNPHFIISDEEMSDRSSMSESDIQAFLERNGSGLARLRLPETMLAVSAIIAAAAQEFRINPKVLLVLLQKEQSLVLDPTPSAKQLDWATGYGVCDACSLNEPTIQRFRGFVPQVRSAAEFFRAILDGRFVPSVRKGILSAVDRVLIQPLSTATASLYAYTPHIQGNRVFWGLWNRWFNQNYPEGTLVRAPSRSTIWFIQYGQKRQLRSPSVLRSRFGSQPILTAATDQELEKYPMGPAITLPNYSVVRMPDGAISLLDGDEIRHITSPSVFRLLGFHPEEIEDVAEEALQGYRKGLALTAASAYPTGGLISDRAGRNIYYARDGVKRPVIDRAMLAQFPMLKLTRVSNEELNMLALGEPMKLLDGTLVRLKTRPAVYLASQGFLRPIASGSVFLEMGFQWKDVRIISPALFRAHQQGPMIDVATKDIPTSAPRAQFQGQ